MRYNYNVSERYEDITFYEKTLNFALKSKQKQTNYYGRGIK